MIAERKRMIEVVVVQLLIFSVANTGDCDCNCCWQFLSFSFIIIEVGDGCVWYVCNEKLFFSEKQFG